MVIIKNIEHGYLKLCADYKYRKDKAWNAIKNNDMNKELYMASIKDVAKRANVGVGTVSRALNGTGYISVEAKKRIEEAVEELNYTPNELARNLFRKRTGIIGVVIPNLAHPFFAQFTKNVEMELYKHGYKTMVCNTVGISNREKEYLDMLQRNIVDGIITGAHSLDNEEYLKNDKPIVSLDHDFGPTIPIISSNHKQGGRLAAEKLIANGCKNVIQFAGSSKVRTPSNDRHIEFERIMKQNNIQVKTVETAWNVFTYDYYHEAVSKFMETYTDIDGVFTADIPAICCLNIARKKGIRVPEDLKIVAYDATDITRITDPVITAVAQNIGKLAKACVKTMINLIDGKKDCEYQQIFDVTMQEGGTTYKQ